MQLNFDNESAESEDVMDVNMGSDTDNEDINFDSHEEEDMSALSELDDEAYDYAKEQKIKKMALAAIATTMGLVLVALIVAIIALTNQKTATREIKEWVADYLAEKLEEAGISSDGIEGITDDLNYLLGESLGTDDLDFSQLTEDQIKELLAKMSATMSILPEEDRNRIASELLSGYIIKASGENITSEDMQTVLTRLSDLEYNDKQLANALANVKGQTGATGAQGKAGTNGTNGRDGKDGVNGRDGAAGRDGVNGKDGVNGTNGKDGINGTDGKDGKNGEDGLTAYELYKQSGGTLTEPEWLKSLQGKSAHVIYRIKRANDAGYYYTDDATNIDPTDTVVGSTTIVTTDDEWNEIKSNLPCDETNLSNITGLSSDVFNQITNVNNYTQIGVKVTYQGNTVYVQ